MEVSQSALREVEDALRGYELEVAATRLSTSTKDTYLRHASHFVRWLKGDFDPGVRVAS